VPAQWLIYCDVPPHVAPFVSWPVTVPAQWLIYCDRGIVNSGHYKSTGNSACAVADLLRPRNLEDERLVRDVTVPAQWLIYCDWASRPNAWRP